jgi:hypothetical protein
VDLEILSIQLYIQKLGLFLQQAGFLDCSIELITNNPVWVAIVLDIISQ